MKFLLNGLKKRIKRSSSLMSLINKALWKRYVLIDWWGTRVWRKTKEVVTPHGFKLASGLHPAYKMMRTGDFEVDETALILRTLNRVSVFVDIGANLGYYTCLALSQNTPVIAFEPQKHNLECLFQNLFTNGWEKRAEIFPLALSNEPGLLTLYGASGPSASLIKNWADYSSSYKQIVPVTTLDNVLGGRYIDSQLFIKIDVEGAEYQVMKGALNTLDRKIKPYWLLEICLNEFHPQGINPDYKDIFNLFRENGYQAYTISENAKPAYEEDIIRWVNEKSTDDKTYNYLFVDEQMDTELFLS